MPLVSPRRFSAHPSLWEKFRRNHTVLPVWDSHCHLQLDPLFQRAELEMKKAREKGISGALVPAFAPLQWERQLALAARWNLGLGFGIHPWCIKTENGDEMLESFRRESANLDQWGKHLVAIGEFGLDRSSRERKETFSIQKQLFQEHLDLAQSRQLPIILHVVRCHGHALEILANNEPRSGVVHSYSGPLELVRSYVDLGLALSFSGNLLTSAKARECLCAAPQESILFETDGPTGKGLSDSGQAGPSSLEEVLGTAAEILGKTKEWCRSLHSENTTRVFGKLMFPDHEEN